MVNRTNNALERYDKRFNALFPKKPSLLEFVQIVEAKRRVQADDLRQVRTNRRQEVKHDNPTIPDIDRAYYVFKKQYARSIKK